jgi:hypothetical protein
MLKKDDKVTWDGDEWLILDIRPRDEAEPLQGVKLIGNVVTLQHVSGAKIIHVYDFDIGDFDYDKFY